MAEQPEVRTELRNVLTVYPGDQVVIDDKVRTVARRETRPPKKDESERQVILHFTETFQAAHGDEGQDIRVVVP